MSNAMKLIFVYGTLKRGGHNHHFISRQTFAGPAHTTPGFTLFDLGGYPGLVADIDAEEGVSGEVWSIDDECLSGLDVLEGTAEGLYRREPIALSPPFADRQVDAYFYNRSVRDRKRIGEHWDG